MKKTLFERARLLFDMNGGEITDKQLCAEFDDREVHDLFMGDYIEPLDGQTWRWVRIRALSR